MIVKSGVVHDSRVRREAGALTKAGFRVTVIGDSGAGPLSLDLSEVHFVRELSDAPPRKWGRLSPIRWLLLPEHRVRSERAFRQAAQRLAVALGPFDVVHAHDFPVLATVVGLAQRWNARVVYDSHEWWRGRARFGRPEPIRKWRQARLETRLIMRADRVVTVSAPLATLLEGVGARDVAVVRNSFPAREMVPQQPPSGIVYAGRISRGRDLETLLQVEGQLGVAVHLMGESDGSLEVPDSVTVHSMAELKAVDELLVATGIAVVPLMAGPVNHDVALPNKLFHAVACGVPVVAADLPAMRSVVQKYGLGVLYKVGDPESLVRSVAQVVERYEEFRESVVSAQESLSWDRDAERLVELYREL